MADIPNDWSTWIITTIMAALTTMIGTVVALARIIESKYQSEIKDLKADFVDYKSFAANERATMKVETEKCLADRMQLAIRVAQLESKIKE